MKILFLDFDGVLFPIPADGHLESRLEPSAEAVANLNLLVQLTGARVVVTSAWREDRTVQQLEELLRGWGYAWSVLDKTRATSYEEDRGADVRAWLAYSTEPVEAFVVVDDEPTDLESLAKHRVMPKPDVGLQFHDVQEAVRMLAEVGA